MLQNRRSRDFSRILNCCSDSFCISVNPLQKVKRRNSHHLWQVLGPMFQILDHFRRNKLHLRFEILQKCKLVGCAKIPVCRMFSMYSVHSVPGSILAQHDILESPMNSVLYSRTRSKLLSLFCKVVFTSVPRENILPHKTVTLYAFEERNASWSKIWTWILMTNFSRMYHYFYK